MRFLLCAMLLLTTSSYALEVEYFPSVSKDGIFQNATKVTCSYEEANLCNYMCGNSYVCYRPELVCTSCAGRQDMLLRILFTQSHVQFSRSHGTWSNSQLAAFLFDEAYILLSYRSMLNFHKAWGSQEVLEAFRTFCPNPTPDPLLIVSLDERNKPHRFVGVICQDNFRQSYVEIVKSNLDLNYELEQQLQ